MAASTVVGASVGVQELDLQLILQDSAAAVPRIAAHDLTTGPRATLGGQGSCFQSPYLVAAPAKIVMAASQGSGVALGQVFVR